MDIMDILIAGMPKATSDACDFWQDGEEVFCRTEDQANAIAELFVKLLPNSTVVVTLLEEIGWYCVNV